MIILEDFKKHLLLKKDNPSRATVKNYTADIRKFILWLESETSVSFNPKQISLETIGLFKHSLLKNNAPKASVNRYLSSLRCFFDFLEGNKLVLESPFRQEVKITHLSPDPLLLSEFSAYLRNNKLSRVSIKNYLMDLKQFLDWLEAVAPGNSRGGTKIELLKQIDPFVVDEYKNRLFRVSGLSATSVNRKLSSIRRYLAWAGGKHIVINNLKLNKNAMQKRAVFTNSQNVFSDIQPQNIKKIIENEDVKKRDVKPITIKSANIWDRVIDFVFVTPSINTIEAVRNLLWLLNGRNLFTKPEAKKYAPSTEIKYFNISSYIRKKNIHNIAKSAYAPLSISIAGLPKHKKILFHLRYTRPNWYKIYHSYPISNYFHVGILIIFTTLFGSSIYYAANGGFKQSGPVFASPADSKPKKLFFRGTLTDANNNPITQETALRIGIYNNETASGSALLWQEVQNVTPDQYGKFSAEIGVANPLPSSVFYENSGLFLGMTIANSDELKPRQQLATVAYSGNSQRLQGLKPITDSGAGTSNVVLALDSAGNLTIGGKASPTFEATGGKFTISGNTVVLNSTTGSDSNIEISPDGHGIIDLLKPIQNTSNYNNIPSALGSVEIDDLFSVLATSSGQSAFTINQNGTGPIISASSSGTAKFILENDGSGLFAGDLIINGRNLTSANTSFELLNKDVFNLNIAGSATSISIGAPTGLTKFNNTILANGGLTIGAGRSLIVSGNVASDLTPFTTGRYNLGSETFHWKNAYIDNLYTSTTASVSGFWQRGSGIISPLNLNDDLIMGGSTGSARFRVIGSGLMAGTASTAGQLTFTNSSQVNLLNSANLGFYGSYGGDQGINTVNPIFYLATGGKVGIGTSNPGEKLEVQGVIKAQGLRVTNGGLINFEDGGGNQLGGIKAYDLGGAGGAIGFLTEGVNSSVSEKMRLDGKGSLVLGATQANATLDIHGNTGTLSIASVSGKTANAALLVDNQGTGDIFSASSSGETRFVISQNGNVGIGDSNPQNTFKVNGSVCVNNTPGACAGNASGTIYAVNTTLQNADVAENYISALDLEPGDIIMPEGKENNTAVVKTVNAYQNETIGIISTKPGITLNSEAKLDTEHPYLVPVALAGRVPVKVTSENGLIRAGDYITTSSKPGVGMKATRNGMAVGKALEGYANSNPAEIGKIVVFVNLTYFQVENSTGYNGKYNVTDNKTGITMPEDTLIEAVFNTIGDGFIQAQESAGSTYQDAADKILAGGQTLREIIASIVQEILDKQLTKEMAEISRRISAIDNAGSNLNLLSPLASEGAIVIKKDRDKLSIEVNGNASVSGAITSETLNTVDATVSGTLRVHNLIADNLINNATASATYITNITNIYNSSNSGELNNSDASASAGTGIASISAEQSAQATSSAIQTEIDPTANSLDNQEVLQLMAKNSGINNDFADLASLSGQLIYTPSLRTKSGEFSEGLMVFGPTTLSDTAIAGNLNVGGSLILANNSINTLGSDLELQPLRQGNLSIMGGLFTINTNGDLKVAGNANFAKDVNIKGKLAVNIIAPVPDSDLVIELGKNQESRIKNQAGINNGQELIIKDSSGSGVFVLNQLGDLIASGGGTFAKLAVGDLRSCTGRRRILHLPKRSRQVRQGRP